MIKMGREECLVMKFDHFLVFLAVWVLFPYVFGQLRELLILGSNEMIRVVHVIACPVDFDLLCDTGQQPGVLKMLLLYICIPFRAFTLSVLNMIGWDNNYKPLIIFQHITLIFCLNERIKTVELFKLASQSRNGKIVWKHGPNRPFFLYNLTSENY